MMTFGLTKPVYSFGLLAPGFIIIRSGLRCIQAIPVKEMLEVERFDALVRLENRTTLLRSTQQPMLVLNDRVMQVTPNVFLVTDDRTSVAEPINTPEIEIELLEIDKDCPDDI